MPRNTIACLGLGAVVLVLVLALPSPELAGERAARQNVAGAVVWAALLLTLPWRAAAARRIVRVLGVMALAVSVADTFEAVGTLAREGSAWAAARLLRGLLGFGTSLLVLWSGRYSTGTKFAQASATTGTASKKKSS